MLTKEPMDKIVIRIESDAGGARASEILADLRSAAETLFFPMKMVGFWDYQADLHLCPQEERREPCPHKLAAADPKRVEYARTLQRERRASVAVSFPHADVTLFMS